MEWQEYALAAVGLTPAEERAYLALVRRRQASPADVSRDIGATGSATRAVLEALEAKGFASRLADRRVRFVAAPPDVAVEAAIHRQLEGMERARHWANELAEQFRTSTSGAPVEVVEVVLGREAVIQRWAQLQQIVTTELVAFDRPPYSQPVPDVNPDEDVALRRGVSYRIIYHREALEWPGMLAHIERYVAAGEDARVLAEVPMKLDIVDRKLGLVPVTLGDPGRMDGALLVHPSPLLETLTFLFEILWEQAVPLSAVLGSATAGTGPGPDQQSPGRSTEHLPGAPGAPAEHGQLLALLAAGLKDEAIARQLGVGLRTVNRRVAALMHAVGAQTRYQAGLQAARRGWYEGLPDD